MIAAIKNRALAAWVAALVLAGCSTPPPQDFADDPESAARNCELQGGTRRVERGSGGEIAVCVFPDGRQCEEWALLLGRCPRGGISVGGYATTNERHCAVRGGQMTIPGCALSPVGLYETTLPTRGGSARNVVLVLDAGRAAMLSTTYSGSAGRYLAPGTWRSSGSVITVSTEHERLVFDYINDKLIPREWDRSAWGGGGPGTLVRLR